MKLLILKVLLTCLIALPSSSVFAEDNSKNSSKANSKEITKQTTNKTSADTTGFDSKLPVEVTADSLEVFQEANRAIFKGSVIAKQGVLDIRANEMEVYYDAKKTTTKSKTSQDNSSETKSETKVTQNSSNTASNKITKVKLKDKVFISTPNETGRGDSGEYNVSNSLITLEGNVVLTSKKNIVKGDRLVYNLKTGISKIISNSNNSNANSNKKPAGRVTGVFLPSQ